MTEHLAELSPRQGTAEEKSKRVSCLVLHGLGGGPYELMPLITALETAAVRVVTPVLPGHDGEGPVMPASLWRDWAGAAEAAFDELSAHGDEVVAAGFSTGATLALYLASRRPVARLVLLAPFMTIRFSGLIPLQPARYLRTIARFMPNLPRRPPAVRDPAMRRWALTNARYKTFSILATLSALELIETVKPLVPQIKTETLIIQGMLDTVIEPAGAAWIHDHLGSTKKTIVRLLRTDHLVALDHEREQVIELARKFILGD